MDRTAASAYLTSEYSDLATDSKFTTDQLTAAYNTAIDMSLRYLDVSESDLATYDVVQDDILKYIALLNYFALKRFQRLLSIRTDVKLAKQELDVSRSQAFNAVSKLLSQAEQNLLSFGISMSGQDFELGRLTLDFQEPSLPAEFAMPSWWF
jgi:hypothetical protein